MAPAGTNPKIEELRFKLKTDPKGRHFYPLAEELRKIGQFAEAEQALRGGLATHTTYLSGWVVLGRVLREQQKHAEAVEALTRALELDRENVVAARLLADSYLALGEKVEAIKKYKLADALMPGDDEVEAAIHRLQSELNMSPAGAVPLSAPPPEQPLEAPPEPPPTGDVFDTTYTKLTREAKVEIETGDVEPMSAAHAESPFEEPVADAGYSADAFDVEQPAGMHLAAPPMEADLATPFPSPQLPPEPSPAPSPEPLEDADVFEPASDVAPGFIQGAFGANVPPPPAGADDFAKTITMADLYANQGLIDEARDIYEDVLARDPGNASVRAKLDALEVQSAPADIEEQPLYPEEDSLAAIPDFEPTPPPPPPAPPPVITAPAAVDTQRPKVEKLQSWLSKVKRNGVEGV